MEKKSQCRGSAKWPLLGLFVPLVSLFMLICPLQEVEGVQHQVGGTPGWSLPSRANVNYTTWANTQTFIVGDTLYFNYSSEYHNVLEVTEAKYMSCDASNPIAQWDDGATIIPLNSSGTLYYICGIPGHCVEGQKVAVQVIATQIGTQHQVGGTPGWSLPSRSNVNYTDWASTQTFLVGDTLYFNYSKDYHNVLQVTEAKYDNCDASSPIAQWDDGATVIALNKTGTFYYICGIPGHCQADQKVAVHVEASSNSTSTSAQAPMTTSPISPGASPSPPPASTSPLSLSREALSTLLALSLISILLFPIAEY